MTHDGETWMFILMGAGLLVSLAIKHLVEKRRRAAMQQLANEMRFQFDPQKNRSLANGFRFLKHLNKGHNRYAHNILSGHSHDGEPAMIFDYHYETGSGKHKSTHRLSVFILKLPRTFPELLIEPEGFGSLLQKAIGMDDINFESHAFSRRYAVKSRDKKFAYDFCHARMIEYLMRHRNFIIEVDHCNITLVFKQRLSPALCRANYHRLLEIRSLMPDYLFHP